MLTTQTLNRGPCHCPSQRGRGWCPGGRAPSHPRPPPAQSSQPEPLVPDKAPHCPAPTALWNLQGCESELTSPTFLNNLRNLKKWKCCQSWVRGKVTGEGSSGSIQSPGKKQRKSFSCTNRDILSCINVKTDKASGIRVKLIKRAQLSLVKHF